MFGHKTGYGAGRRTGYRSRNFEPSEPPGNDPQSDFGPRLVFEDFNTTASEGSDFWTKYPLMGHYPGGASPWPDTSGNGLYSGDYVSAVNGNMRLRMLTAGGTPRVVAARHWLPGASSISEGQLYGRYEVRFKVDGPAPHYKIAWLLWPDSDDWTDGEIDFPEVTFTDETSTIMAFNHEVTGTPANNSTAHDTEVTPYDWHTATIEWEPGEIRFYLDGVLEATDTSHVPSVPMHWVLQCETALDGTPPDPETECIIDVDYIAIWDYEEEIEPGTPLTLYFRNTSTETGTDGTNIWNLSTSQGGSNAWLYPGGAEDSTWVETHRFQMGLANLPHDDSYSVSAFVADLSEATEARIRLQRLNSSGVVQESSAYSTVITTTEQGASTTVTREFTFDASWEAGDMLAVAFEHHRTSGTGATTLGLRVNDAASWVEYTPVST